jgi:hypothetical protein
MIKDYITRLKEKPSLQGRLVTNSTGQHIYFSPIVIRNRLCLNCHGKPKANIKSKTMKAIEKHYPNDEATGFELNELRGMWRVELKKKSNQ